MRISRVFLFAVLGAVFFFTSCKGEDIYYQKFQELETNTWGEKDKKSFEFEILDTNQLYDFYFNLRNDKEYGFGNIYLFWTLNSPDGRTKTDTAQFILAKPNGQWLGKSASGTVIENSMYFLTAKLQKKGKYSLDFVQGMREESLGGVKNIGLKIKKKNEPK